MLDRDGVVGDDESSREGPEDMMLGLCAQTYSKIPIIHSGRMFLMGPEEYSDQFLVERKPVSFHKHNGQDPLQVYRDWFEPIDMKIYNEKSEL